MTTSWTASDWEKRPGPWALPDPTAPSATHDLIRSLGGATRRDLAENLLAFCRVLRTVLPNITAGRIIDTCRSLATLDLSDRDDFHTALQANLVSSQEDTPAFEALYQLFWQPFDADSDAGWLQSRDGKQQDLTQLDLGISQTLQQQVADLLSDAWDDSESQKRSDSNSDAPAYSAAEALAQKDFAEYTPDEVREMDRVLGKLTPKLATVLSRRTAASFRGPDIDLRRSFRHNMRYGGEMLQLARRKKKVQKLRLALLCDVSGSMDRYSRFLLQFIYSLENDITGVDAWVFSTRLTEVTPYLRGRSYDECLEHIAQSVHDWSGGTNIGSCLHEFAQGVARERLTRRSVVIIISDGWDRGDVSLLERAMRMLQRQARTVIWLNPLLGSLSYQPLCAGMKAALPYVDHFLPVHNLDSLVKLTRTLNSLSRSL